MHWFWRATIAIGVGIVWMLVLGLVIMPVTTRLSIISEIVFVIVFVWAGILIIPVGIYGWLTRYYHPKRHYLDGETRCRKCGYILRGIPEPRCSECGERI